MNIIKSVIFISKNVKNGDRRALSSTIPIRMLFNKVFYVLLFVIELLLAKVIYVPPVNENIFLITGAALATSEKDQ